MMVNDPHSLDILDLCRQVGSVTRVEMPLEDIKMKDMHEWSAQYQAQVDRYQERLFDKRKRIEGKYYDTSFYDNVYKETVDKLE